MPPAQDSAELKRYREQRNQELERNLKADISQEQKDNISLAINLYKEKDATKRWKKNPSNPHPIRQDLRERSED